MTNWPNIQEYRNFEPKFFDNPKHNDLNNSAAETEVETVKKDEFKNNWDDLINVQKVPESKTVRCVIKKDFEESFKKLDRGDGISVNYETRPKTQETSEQQSSGVDKIRMQNHLKWKKQKEEEYLQKKEAERIAQQRKKEEELQMEKIKKRMEKEREKKIKEWQEQKAREKEEKKREKLVMKVLEEELKETTPAVNKEKLIEEWVKLKNKQKQIEAEKKAEMQKKEEENRAIRQNLAELSYRQWKERVKGRMMTLPKNGYQIFGPKPIPVVKEDWNHDFTGATPQYQPMTLRSTKSNMSNSITFQAPGKELEDLPKGIFYLGALKNRSPSFCHLKSAKSGFSLCNGSQISSKTQKMPLKELQTGTIDIKGRNYFGNKKGDRLISNFLPEDLHRRFSSTKDKKMELANEYSLMYPPVEGDQNRFLMTLQNNKKPPVLNNDYPKNTTVTPNKKKIDLYINSGSFNLEENAPMNYKKKATTKSNDVKINRVKKEVDKKVVHKSKRKITSREKSAPKPRAAKSETVNSQKDGKFVSKGLSVDALKQQTIKSPEKICRRSRSYDKPIRKISKTQETSRSMMKIPRHDDDDVYKQMTKNCKCPQSQKRKIRKKPKPTTPDLSITIDKKPEVKTKKKLKKKNPFLSKSFSFTNSPYSVKKTNSRTLDKSKVSRRKSAKSGETKSDGARQSRKMSTTKI